ncbi:MAG TPA: hypothetical protein VFQ76_08685 [Longimicrobiaceae bacterium]|nr:hypothetical protein [Longimicrobiaceae bacterium]
MPDERRYREEEVAEIFEAAASHRGPGANALTTGEGLTLAELQAIGSEVGMSAERIADAAAALELRRNSLRRTDMGMPFSVRRTVDLPRAPTDREWEVLVAELRETFNARGRDGSHGGLREWSNGNLHARVEPTETGHRLRLGTTKTNAVALNRMGAAGLVMAVVVLMVLALSGTLPESLFLPLMLIAMGGGALGYNAVRLPGWAREREEQMERIAARALALLGGEPEPAEVRAELTSG